MYDKYKDVPTLQYEVLSNEYICMLSHTPITNYI